ncbi:cell wall protein DAN4 isoform X21 [Xenopus tropicalis]|uniref:Cell wall protein DAN4 isoform X21 n=1 Tax=Xenopus tropicalis TaxID=8364 RepID=A0A8J1JVX8_XENTR|nr:cell wall protein DAN4 isoform X21 [Xenopus tropicalis]
MDLSTILGLLLLALNSVQVTYGNALLYPYGPGLDTINPKSDDGGSGPIQLSMKIPVFGMAFSSLYVSNNGLLSFNASIGSYVPSNVTSSLGNPFLAPFWADVYNINQGDIYYRESTNTTLLSQATTDIRRYFPNKNFSAKWVFVATWNNVSYYGSTSNKGDTFQAVLPTDGNLTFVMFNYGEIEWTTGTSGGGSSATGLGGTAALAGLNCGGTMACYVIPGSLSPSIINISSTSNVGFPGRWAFQVNDLTPGFPNVIIETTSVTTTPMETTTTKETTTPLRTTKETPATATSTPRVETSTMAENSTVFTMSTSTPVLETLHNIFTTAETTTTLTRTPMVLQTLQVTSSTETTTVPITIPTLGTTQEMSTTETRTSTASTLEATPETSLPTETTSGLRASPLVQETSTAETTTVPITIATLGTTQEMSTTETRTSTASTLEATPETSSPTETTSSFRASPLVQETSTAETTTVPTTIPALGTTQEMSTTAETTTKVTRGSTLEATPETSSPAETTSGLRASPLVQETSTAALLYSAETTSGLRASPLVQETSTTETITVPITIPTLGTTQEMSTTEAASILTSRRVETTRETSITAGTRAFSTPDLTLPVLETTQQTSRIDFAEMSTETPAQRPAQKAYSTFTPPCKYNLI